MICRRKFLNLSIASFIMMSSKETYAEGKKIKRYKLVAKATDHSFSNNQKLTNLWLLNNSCPGPLITAEKGDILEVEFTNLLGEPTTLHWHGIRNLNSMDGVPYVSQPLVETGETFVYRFPINETGTYWYHAHNKAWEHVARGLYGPLIITNNLNNSLGRRDILVVADDWLINENNQVDEESFGNLMHWSHAGRYGNRLSINGQFSPKIEIPSYGPLRLRFINTANARILSFSLLNKNPLNVISIDGISCKLFKTQKIVLGPAQRVDLLIEDSSQLKSLFEVSNKEPLKVADFITTDLVIEDHLNLIDPIVHHEVPPLTSAKIIEIHMQGGAMGNLSSAIFEGEKKELRELALDHSKLWAFNGHIGNYDLQIAKVNLGDLIILKVWNDTNWPHSMHLHGQHFWVNSQELSSDKRYLLRDTYLMDRGEKSEFIFKANNPGDWLFHCHMLEHHASGMGGVISVA